MTSRGDVSVREIAPEIAPAVASINARLSWFGSSIPFSSLPQIKLVPEDTQIPKAPAIIESKLMLSQGSVLKQITQQDSQSPAS